VADAGNWPIETVELDRLDLDLRNVRIRGAVINETYALNYLFAEEDVADLAHSILRDGYVDNELPIVVEDGDHYLVLEGNRRVSALKGLNDPDAVPSYSKVLDRFLSRYSSAPVPPEIRVMIAPSREAAAPLLARLHTTNPKKAWRREQQATFYYAQLSPTTSVDDLKTTFPSAAKDIPRFIRMAEMRALIKSLKFEDPAIREYATSDKLTMSAFEYAHSKPQIRLAAGLIFAPDGLLVSKKLTRQQVRVLQYILAGFKFGQLSTRSPQLQIRSGEHAIYVGKLKAIAAGTDPGDFYTDFVNSGGAESEPADSRPESGPADSGDPESDPADSRDPQSGSPDPEAGQEGGSRGPNRGFTRDRLDMLGMSYTGQSAGIRRRFEELRLISVRNLPNSAYYLLRSILECSIKHYFRLKNEPLASGTTLSAAVTHAARHFSQLRDNRMTAVLNGLSQGGQVNADQFYRSAPALNTLIHEPDAFVNAEHVHHAWEHMAPLIKRLLEDDGISQQSSEP
jgi:hypothetical protein